MLTNKHFRAVLFDAAPKNTLLLSIGGRETFLVSSQDKSIGREVFITTEFEFDNLVKALNLIGGKFHRQMLIDVGANIGSISIPAIKRNMFENAIAIEPDPFNYSLLVSNIHINGLADKITTHNLALGAREEDLVLVLSDTNYGHHHIKISDAKSSYDAAFKKSIVVKSGTFDGIVGAIDPACTLIWMDTEGYEGKILEGAAKALENNPPLVLEFVPYGMALSGSFSSLKQAILGAGYTRFYDLSLDMSPTPVSTESLDELYHKFKSDIDYGADLLILS
ncbi:MAG: FkbM family methyltransferase [Terracidiphilus sp.]